MSEPTSDIALWFRARAAGWECPKRFKTGESSVSPGWQDSARGALAAGSPALPLATRQRVSEGPRVVVANAKQRIPHTSARRFYIGRKMRGLRHGDRDFEVSPLANPYKVIASAPARGIFGHHVVITRSEAIGRYREHFAACLSYPQENSVGAAFRHELREIYHASLNPAGVVLICWCAPKSCHGDVIREHILKMHEEGRR